MYWSAGVFFLLLFSPTVALTSTVVVFAAGDVITVQGLVEAQFTVSLRDRALGDPEPLGSDSHNQIWVRSPWIITAICLD